MKFKPGEYVKIIEREQTAADIKNQTFYPYYCGLAGTVDRVYDDLVCLNVDIDTLPDGVKRRHMDIQDSVKQKWLNGLSNEARNRLTAEEKRFQLAYTLLVNEADLEKSKAPEIKSSKPVEAADPKPVTSDDLSEAELAFLREREEAIKQDQ
ncbi:MAG TPA: hypothetical protein VGK34_08350 [Armatimonadota bacterium]